MGYEQHPDQNWLSLPVCHLTEFGLFGELRSPPPGDEGGTSTATDKIYLPVIISAGHQQTGDTQQTGTIYLPLIIKGEDSSAASE